MSSMKMNRIVVSQLEKLAKLSSLAGEIQFKAHAYTRAAEQIRSLDRPIEEVCYSALPGIGSSIAQKIKQIIDTGTCAKMITLSKYEPMLPLLNINGVGPKTACRLYFTYGACSISDVRDLIARKVITDDRIVKGITVSSDHRVAYSVGRSIADRLIGLIEAKAAGAVLLEHIEAAGSIRRRNQTVGDLDIIVCCNDRLHFNSIIADNLDQVAIKGYEKISGHFDSLDVDFRYTELENLGAMLLYFTGPKEFNIRMRQKANRLGLTLNEYGLWRNEKELIASRTEEEIFEALGMSYLEPVER